MPTAACVDEGAVSVSDDGPVFVDMRARRADVVDRLLDMGVAPRTLATLLPEWEELIATVAAGRMRGHDPAARP